MNEEVWNISSITGLIGGIAGLITLFWTIFQYIIKKPKLELVAPMRTIGNKDDNNDEYVMMVLVKIANLRDQPCFVYWESINTSILINKKWIDIQALQLHKDQSIETDLDSSQKEMLGIGHIGYFNIHDAIPIKNDAPYIKLINYVHNNRKDLERAIKIKISFRDSQKIQHTLISTLQHDA